MIINNIKLKFGEDEKNLIKIAEKKAGKKGYFRILKKSLDARDKNNIFYVYSVEISDEPFKMPSEDIKEYNYPKKPIAIIGFGPAGIFSALRLVRAGFNVIVIERGKKVEERQKDVARFFFSAILNTESNIQFGEGGAGTFSDGKLNTGVRSEYKDYVLYEFVKHKAPKEILIDAKPHIGSDILPEVVKSLREEIIQCGGKLMFGAAVSDITLKNGKVVELTIKNDSQCNVIEVSDVILAIGHSSRDTYEMLSNKGIAMEAKDLAVGFRIEHLREDINLSQFGKDIGIAADYKLT